jgi:hypothetical protein
VEVSRGLGLEESSGFHLLSGDRARESLGFQVAKNTLNYRS